MKRTKKLFLIAMCLTLLVLTVVGITLTASAEVTDDSGSCGENVTYTFDAETGTLAISGEGAMASFDYNTMPWYSYRSSIKTITIEDGVTSIGSYAFRNCSSLTSITIPNGVTSIGSDAFSYCSSLTSINIPDSVTRFGFSAFGHCSSLTNITIQNSVTYISQYAFEDCSSLTSITIPNSVTGIGSGAFYRCSSLTSITVDENNPNYCAIDGNLYNKNATTLIHYAIGKTDTSFTIPDSVTSIDRHAFSYCSSLTSINIPDSVTSIGYRTFSHCSSLTSITIPNSVTSIGDDAFHSCSSLTSITIPDSVTSICQQAFYNCTSLTSITIPDSVTSIGSWAFSNCISLTSITIPDSVTSIGIRAFSNCRSLTSIDIPDGVTSIGNYAFYNCTSLTSITIPDSVTSIGNYAFSYCSSLTSVTIGNGVTSIGNSAFRYCYDLEKIIYCGTSTEWNAISKGSSWDSSAGRDTANGTYTLQYHSYVDGVCEYCGAIQPVINNVNIAIGQDIIVNYYATVPSDYTNLTMQFTMGNKTATVAGIATDVANQYVFAFEGVSPQCMGDAITAQLYSGTDLIAEKGLSDSSPVRTFS